MKNIIKGILLLGCCTQISHADGESDIEQQQEQQKPPTQQHLTQEYQIQVLSPQTISPLNSQETQPTQQQDDNLVVSLDDSDLERARAQTQSNPPSLNPPQVQQQTQTGSWSLLYPSTWWSSNQPPQTQQQSLPSTQQQAQTGSWSIFNPWTWGGSQQQIEVPQLQRQNSLPEIIIHHQENDGEAEKKVQTISELPSRDSDPQSENGDVNQENEMPDQQVQQEQPKDEEHKLESPSRHRRQQASLIEPEEEQQPDATDQAQVQQQTNLIEPEEAQQLLALGPPSMVSPVLPRQQQQTNLTEPEEEQIRLVDPIQQLHLRMPSLMSVMLLGYTPFTDMSAQLPLQQNQERPGQQEQQQLNQGQQGLSCLPKAFFGFGWK